MLKAFAAALAPIVVLGRGLGDGTSQENAGEIELIPAGTTTGTSLKLYTYNMVNTGIDELHGDLSYTMTSKTGAMDNDIEMGFCFRPSAATGATASTKWDCQRVRTNVDPKNTNSDYQTKFDHLDLYWTGATPPSTPIPAAQLIKDDDSATVDDQGKNWKSVPGKSLKTSCTTVSTTDLKVWCKELNAHFVRNWSTSAATATPADQDLQLKAENKDQDFDVFGWITSNSKPDFTGTATLPRIGKILKTKFVYSKYLDEKAAAAKVAADKAAQAAADAAALARKNKRATSLTTYATALVATCYILAF